MTCGLFERRALCSTVMASGNTSRCHPAGTKTFSCVVASTRPRKPLVCGNARGARASTSITEHGHRPNDHNKSNPQLPRMRKPPISPPARVHRRSLPRVPMSQMRHAVSAPFVERVPRRPAGENWHYAAAEKGYGLGRERHGMNPITRIRDLIRAEIVSAISVIILQ